MFPLPPHLANFPPELVASVATRGVPIISWHGCALCGRSLRGALAKAAHVKAHARRGEAVWTYGSIAYPMPSYESVQRAAAMREGSAEIDAFRARLAPLRAQRIAAQRERSAAEAVLLDAARERGEVHVDAAVRLRRAHQQVEAAQQEIDALLAAAPAAMRDAIRLGDV